MYSQTIKLLTRGMGWSIYVHLKLQMKTRVHWCLEARLPVSHLQRETSQCSVCALHTGPVLELTPSQHLVRVFLVQQNGKEVSLQGCVPLRYLKDHRMHSRKARAGMSVHQHTHK